MVDKLSTFYLHFLLCYGAAITTSPRPDVDFDYLTFAQFWPTTTCWALDNVHEKCNTTGVTNNWTIHGLWPSKENHSPMYCNKSMAFDFNQIKSLGPRLEKSWHNLNSSQGPHSMWKYEWSKHGTCAYSMPSLRGEMKYFSKALDLHSGLHTLKALSMSGIVPDRKKPYEGSNIYNALVKYYKTKPYLSCARKPGRSYIDEIRVCFDKNFKLIDCHNQGQDIDKRLTFGPCHPKEIIYYRPLRHTIED